MAPGIADRLVWAVNKLHAHPDDHILEISCGQGAAADLICEKLMDGKSEEIAVPSMHKSTIAEKGMER